jgi:hypothetical protein
MCDSGGMSEVSFVTTRREYPDKVHACRAVGYG